MNYSLIFFIIYFSSINNVVFKSIIQYKIILARSILKDSEFIILDEALSEVGIEEEKEIIKKLFKYFKEKTIIYISHKQEIIDLFNEKYKLERSKA